MPNHSTRTSEKDDIFITALQNGNTVARACEAAGYARSRVFVWRDDDAEFAKRWRKARREAAELLEEEADRRGRDGYQDPVFYQGQPTSSRTKYSDGLLIARLKAELPEKYQERQQPIVNQQQMTVVVHDVTTEAALLRLIEEQRAPTIDDLPMRLKQRLLKNAP